MSILKLTEKSYDRLRQLREAVQGDGRVWIVLHDGPDPDAMASGFVIQQVMKQGFGIDAFITYGGIIGRPDNRAMPELLGIEIHHISTVDVSKLDRFICVDTQPAFSNNCLSQDENVAAVIDHHPEETSNVPFVDVRSDVGAATTIATEYLCAQELELTTQLATAIAYGIISETEDLGRKVSIRDLRVYMWVLQKADHVLIGKLRHPRVERAFFRTLAAALNAACVHENVVVCHLQNINASDELARVADILNPLEHNTWVFCSGERADEMILTLRSSDMDTNAEQVMSEILAGRGGGGGHGMVAGGQIQLEEGENTTALRQKLTERFLKAVGLDKDSDMEPLLNPPAGQMIPEKQKSSE